MFPVPKDLAEEKWKYENYSALARTLWKGTMVPELIPWQTPCPESFSGLL